MIRLTAHVSGSVQRVGYRAKVISLAKEMGFMGIVQNQPDGRVLVVAEGEKKDDLERFASAIRIENALIHVEDISAKYSQGTGQYSTFRKITGPEEVGERLDDGIEILKEMLASLNNLTAITKDLAATTKDIATTTKDTAIITKDIATTTKDTAIITKDIAATTKEGLAKQDQGLGKMDQMIDKQDETTEAIRDLKRNDERFVRMEKDIRMIKNRLGIR